MVTVERFAFDGEFGEGVVSLPFEPLLVIVDYDEKLADAIVDYNIEVNSTGTKNASEANVKVIVNGFSEPTLLRVEDNYVAPDPLKNANPNIVELTDAHYWRLASLPASSLSGPIRFMVRISENGLDYDFFNGHDVNELLLLYRENPSCDWEIIHCDKTVSSSLIYLTTDGYRNGEYTIALGTEPTVIPANGKRMGMSVYPNPATASLTIELPDSYDANTSTGCMYDANGKLVRSFLISGSHHEMNTSELPAGVYILKVSTGSRNPLTATVSILNNR